MSFTSDEELLTLAFDTATERRSVALVRGARVLSTFANDAPDGGSANVLCDIERALEAASVGLDDVGLFACATGPGSFTGLRAGVATLKALALTLDKPAVGVQTLHALAHAARPAGRLVSMIPAGRGEVFAQILSASGAGEIVEREPPTHLPPALLIEKVARLGGAAKWAGGGAHKFIELIREGAGAKGFEFKIVEDEGCVEGERKWVIAPLPEALAVNVAALGRAKFLGGGSEGASGLRAIYVRPSDAELNEQCHARG
ncbi:MAG TPA: tRNA (adenosine(37)-N6)-threonylcarbamoyltransferase complex dimerization subunit type 1 TsaB [Pyrinomonadaceae bacterium]|nr:tRNA (adenosine(37)-N6)-threonylcarbamoyltransferase complex dimerization subunit type 1 TsaB [Pyrinomonadaceae bacterium]